MQKLIQIRKQLEHQKLHQLILFVAITAFVIIEAPEIFEVETFPDYDDNVAPFLATCDVAEFPDKRGALKWWFICASDQLLGNERIIPFAFSIMLLPITFGFVRALTQSNLAGTLTVLILLSSGVFTTFDTTSTYEQSWVVFLMLSMWVAIRGNWWLSPILFVVAFACKPLALAYFPMIFYLILAYPATKGFECVRHIQALAFLITGATIIGTIAIVASRLTSTGGALELNVDELIAGFYNWFFYLDTSLIVAWSIPLVMIKLLHMKFKNKNQIAGIIFVFIIGIILTVPLIEGLSNQINHAYRFVPLVIFGGAGLSFIVALFLKPKQEITTPA